MVPRTWIHPAANPKDFKHVPEEEQVGAGTQINWKYVEPKKWVGWKMFFFLIRIR